MSNFEAEPRQPRPVNEIIKGLESVLKATPDPNREGAVRETDLSSEIAGLTVEIAELIEQMKQTKDPALPAELDSKTTASMQAQAELQVLNGERTS